MESVGEGVTEVKAGDVSQHAEFSLLPVYGISHDEYSGFVTS